LSIIPVSVKSRELKGGVSVPPHPAQQWQARRNATAVGILI
jgi:hypothetical protein